jgi:hypothetical protein
MDNSGVIGVDEFYELHKVLEPGVLQRASKEEFEQAGAQVI